MASVTQTDQAKLDLAEIWSHIAEDSVRAANRWLAVMLDQCRRMAEHPVAGRARDELGIGLRSFPVGNYVVFYRPLPDGIRVIRVLHGMRDLPEIL